MLIDSPVDISVQIQRRGTFLYDPRRNIPVFAVDGNEVGRKAHDRACSDCCFQVRCAGFIRFFLDRFQNGEVLCRVCRSGSLFDLDRVNRAVLIDDQVDLLLVAVAVEIQRRTFAGVQVAFPYFGHYPCLEESACHRAVFQNHQCE